jgi:signal transduction histidine kinase
MNAQVRALLRRPAVLDLGLAALLAALSLLPTWKMIFPEPWNTKLGYEFGSVAALRWHVLAWLLASAAGLGVLPWRRRYPVTVFIVTLAAATVHSLTVAFTPSPADLAVPVAVYTLAARTPRRRSLSVLVAGTALAMTVSRLGPAWASSPGWLGKSPDGGWLGNPPQVIELCVILAAGWLAGDGARTRRAYLAEVERRARDAERERDRQAELASAAERARITRELHDVIAHALSVMVIQAQGAAASLRRRHPADAGDALDAIVTTGRGALTETRRLLGAVRSGPGSGPGGGPELAPQPGLADLAGLVTRIRQTGTRVDLRIEGVPRPLPEGVELSAYRIIQEGLTNAIKHGGPAVTATVRVCYGDADVCLEVVDDGPGTGAANGHDGQSAAIRDAGLDRGDGPPPGTTGHGLAGMRARAAMLGGELTAGPDPAGGFRVHARLPLGVPAG